MCSTSDFSDYSTKESFYVVGTEKNHLNETIYVNSEE